jgi:N-acetylneuraminic acid mutarotase
MLAAGGWQKLPPLPESNGGAAVGVVAGKIVIVGGTHWRDGKKVWLKTVHRYDPAASRWVSGEVLPQAHAYGLAGNWNGTLVVAGGTTGTAPFSGMIRVNADRVVAQAAGGITVPAVIAGGGLVGREFIFTGGADDAANTAGFRRDAFAVDVETGKHRSLPSHPSQALGVPGAAVLGGELFLFGGAGWDADTKTVRNLTEANAFSAEKNAWRSLKALPYAVRGLAAVALDGRRIYLAGGFRTAPDGFTAEAWIYDRENDTYTASVALPVPAMVSLVVADGFLYCLGGEDRPKHRSDEVYRISVADLGR